MLERWRRHLRREHDAGSASMASYVVAAALFIIGSSFLLHFAIEPPGASTASLEHLELRSKADDALALLVGSTGVPSVWDAGATSIEAVKRLGLVENGASIRLDADKFDALAKGKYSTMSSSNGAIDYAEAKAALGLSGYEFHLRAYPLIKPSDSDPYGLSDFDDFRIGYVGAYGTDDDPEASAQTEIAQLTGLNIDFTYDDALPLPDDVFPDDSNTIRDELLPHIGANIQQTIIAKGSGQEHMFYRVPGSTYSALATDAAPTRALAVSSDGATLGYLKNLELRAIVGKVDLTGVPVAQLWWSEYVDTDRGNLSYDCQDYGYVEVSPDHGATWFALTSGTDARSDDCTSAAPVIAPHGNSMVQRSVADLTAVCAACDNNAEVLVAFHWVADNDNMIGYGWVIDDVEVKTLLGETLMRKTFEEPEYDMLIIGSEIDNHAFEPEDVKEALRDYVDLYGGRILITGPDTNVNWLDRLFDAGIAGASGGISTPDVTHPLLTLPNALDYNPYPKEKTWDFTGSLDAGLFSAVVAQTDLKHVLSVSRLGAWGDGTTDEGSVILSSFQPYGFSSDVEARKFFANSITYGKFHYLYLDYGPAVPQNGVVASATRTATMNMYRTGEPSFTEMAFIMYVWPGASTADTATALAVAATPPLSPTATSGPQKVTVSWTYPLSNGSANPVQFRVYRGFSPDAVSTPVATVAYPSPWTQGTTFSFVDDTPALTNGVTYYYTVRLETTGGILGSTSDVVSATPIGAPAAPGAPVATGLAGLIRSTWTAPADTGGGTIFGYRIFGKPDGGSFSQVGEIGNVTTFDHSVADSTSWTYKVQAVNAYGWSADSAVSNAGTAILPIPAPTLTVSTDVGPNNLTLAWVAPNPGVQTIQGYRILHSTNGVDFSELAYLNNPANVSFKDVGLGVNVTKHYKVQAVTEYGDGLLSAADDAKTMATPNTPTWGTIVKTPVTNVRTLTWNAVVVSDTPVVRYDVYRATSVNGALTLIGSSTVATYIDSPGSGNFYYTVRAVSAAGASDHSDRKQSN